MIDLPPILTPEEIIHATRTTRVPCVVDDPSLTDRFSSSYKNYKERQAFKTHNFTWIDHIGRFMPIANWIRTYRWKQWLISDVMAGIAVALMVVPQGMSYAQNLAFLPQVYGIYGAFVPCLVYAVLGSSRHLAVGPVAVTSLLLGSGLTRVFGDFNINPSNPNDAYEAALQERYNHGAIQISFIAGCFYSAIGLFKLGFIINYLSAPVISGFMTGAASIILSTQIKYITGQYYVPRSDTVIQSLQLLFENMALFRWPEFAMGVGFLIILFLCQFLGRRYRRMQWLSFMGPIIVTVLSLIIENAGDYYVIDYNNPATPYIKDVGPIPAGLPAVTVSWWLPLYNVSDQLLLAGIICILDIAESTTVARRVAQQKRYKLDFTQELRALGLTNVMGSIFNCYTTTGAFSRTSINALAGANTLLSSLVTGITVMIILLVATPLFTHLSVNCQGAIVIVAVLPLFDFHGAWYYWDVNKLDFFSWFLTYFVCCVGGALPGIITGVAISIVIFILKIGFPRLSKVTKVPGTDFIADDSLYPDAQEVTEEGVILIKVEATMFFGNLPVIQDTISDEIAYRRYKGDNIAAVVLDCSMVADIDGAFMDSLQYFLNELEDDQVTLIFANPNRKMVLAFQRSGLIVKIRPENLQLTVDEAMARARQVVDERRRTSSEDSLNAVEKTA